ncbi:hypothetical protein ACSLBF_12530 [Pseudoalteromonas sp. T1lg65]|uniref:hypothetical protein n=1 Tax=Pseudoalteromonas sp. T1lg65 TaxID=2077101 RepID=UPI003F79E335
MYRIIAILLLLLVNATQAKEFNTPTKHELQAWFTEPYPISGWALEHTELNYVRLIPKQDNRHAGALYYKNRKGKPCIISVPHKFYDRFTLPIGLGVFHQLCNLLITNSSHRHDEGAATGSNDFSIVGHNLHTNAIEAFFHRHHNAVIFQFHGFTPEKRQTKQAKSAHIILSQGKKNNRKLWELKTCLNKHDFNALVYPQDVSELGGTKNIIHQLPLPPLRFVHIELSLVTRQLLSSSSQHTELFASCLSSSFL